MEFSGYHDPHPHHLPFGAPPWGPHGGYVYKWKIIFSKDYYRSGDLGVMEIILEHNSKDPPAHDVRFHLSCSGIEFEDAYLSHIGSGEIVRASIPFKVSNSCSSGTHTLYITHQARESWSEEDFARIPIEIV